LNILRFYTVSNGGALACSSGCRGRLPQQVAVTHQPPKSSWVFGGQPLFNGSTPSRGSSARARWVPICTPTQVVRSYSYSPLACCLSWLPSRVVLSGSLLEPPYNAASTRRKHGESSTWLWEQRSRGPFCSSSGSENEESVIHRASPPGYHYPSVVISVLLEGHGPRHLTSRRTSASVASSAGKKHSTRSSCSVMS